MSLKTLLVVSFSLFCLAPPAVAAESGAPTGWIIKGSKPDDYNFGVDSTVKFKNKPAAFIKSKVPKTDGFATLTQKINAENYAGQRLKLSGWLKTNNVIDTGGFWMRIDAGLGNMVCFDNMENRPIKGTTDWKEYSIVLDVPKNATQISYGPLLYSTGELWAANLSLTQVGKDTPLTDLVDRETLPSQPVNLDFSAK